MSMPGAFDEHEVYLAVSSTEGEDSEVFSRDEATLDDGSSGDDDDNYEDDETNDIDVGEDDVETGDSQDDYDDDFEIQFESSEDDTDLAEVERMAATGDTYASDGVDAGDNTQAEETPQYTLAVDSTTGSVFIINANGDREDITDALGARPRRGGGFSAQSTLAALRRYISGHTGQAIAANEPAVEDFDDDETESFSWGRYRGRATATGLFPKTVQPIREGVELERRGLFGKPGRRHDTHNRRKVCLQPRNMNDIMRKHEYCTPHTGVRRDSLGDLAVPNSPGVEVAKSDANVYCGQYSKDGTFFYTCAQDFRVRIYDMTMCPMNKSKVDPVDDSEASARRFRSMRMGHGYDEKSSLHLSKVIHAREQYSSWTITDANLSPDNSLMVWSTIGPVVGMSKINLANDNGTDFDENDGQTSLDFGSGAPGGRSMRRHFGIWSLRFSADGREIVAGASSGAIHVYDLESRRTILSISAHEDDVNAVCFADTASSNVLVSGSDDAFLKVWDRRSLGDSGRFTKPSGVLVGHTEGVTYVAPKGDGRFVVSNGKDQTCKLWDLRMMYSSDDFTTLGRIDVSVRGFDYRHGLYKKPRYMKHPNDRSVVTFTGHTVLQTLIRCHFSPEATTGQRYVYSGSYDGKIHIWNLDGTVAQVLDRRYTMPLLTKGATSNVVRMNEPSQPDRPLGTYPTTSSPPIVRDVSWAPFAPVLISSAWVETSGALSGSVAMHEWKGHGKRSGT